ncbi:ferredoxin reductase [Leifsonia sp. F6_8S_P_1B]|uniref:Ferredoxin reductase n=1 Tax=Leifsonia williamsii TaxID=3035919 RepID=A0ABT8KBD2_9MICO|nr:ferredoxin reductase [Leifsonia williamsii]MDN4614769.1 ferredoxin reductase [Leifsonia williamsii]
MSTVWRVADVVDARLETPTARTIRLRIPGLHGHLAGQHVDVRLTAPDGYQAVRSYSIASASGAGLPEDELELTVEELADGEVSPYLVRGLQVGEQLEVRGPVGGWFVWRTGDEGPVQLIAGGSGVVPLMSMARAHHAAASAAPFRLLYSLRTPAAGYYREELSALAADPGAPLRVDYTYTREAPAGWPTAPARLTAATLADLVLPAQVAPTFYLCGSTPFVEAVSGWLIDAGHDPARVRTERYGGIGGAG